MANINGFDAYGTDLYAQQGGLLLPKEEYITAKPKEVINLTENQAQKQVLKQYVKLNSEGLYEVKIPGKPTTVFYNEADAIKNCQNQLTNMHTNPPVPSKHYVKPGITVKPAPIDPNKLPVPASHYSGNGTLPAEVHKPTPVLTPGAEIPKPGAEVPKPGAELPKPGTEIPKPAAEQSAVKGGGKFIKGLKKAGKWGAIAALAVGAGALLLKACGGKDETAPVAEVPSDSKPPKDNANKPAAPADTTETKPAVPPVIPEEPAQPAVDDTENIIQNGDSLEKIAKRYGVTVEQIKELNADKIKQFKTADGKVIEGFIVGEDITLPEGTAKVEGLRNKEEAISDYEEYLRQNLDNIPQTMWNQLCTPEFRRKNKIGEYKAAA